MVYWPVKRLKELSVQINSGNTPKGGSENYVDEGIIFFRSQNVWKDRLEMDDIAYIDNETHVRMKRSSLKHGDILMTKIGRINTENSSLGRAALYMGEDDKANVNGHVYFIRLKQEVNNKFVFRILVSEEYRDLIRSVCVGGIDKRQLNKEHIEEFPIICPPTDIVEEKIVSVPNEMSEYLSIAQMKKLQEVIIKTFAENEVTKLDISNDEFLKMFLAAKRIEGCSDRTINYYEATVEHLLSQIEINVRKITTEEIREYLSNYQKRNNCSNVTIDNIRRNISSFFSWLEEEDYILKSPMKRIHKIKTKTVVKNVISDEEIEKLRDNCKEKRDLAIIDLLYSTGIRVGELVNLNIDDIDFEGRECVVYGKGDKERQVYFDAKAKIHLKEYIESRTDRNKALFVTLDAPYDRLKISGVEIRLRKLGKRLHLTRIHPHKFRRSMATRAIDKGMPIEQVQKILGHSQIDTTMQYAMVNQSNVKTAHQKYMS